VADVKAQELKEAAKGKATEKRRQPRTRREDNK
jgi:hypothetical protein